MLIPEKPAQPLYLTVYEYFREEILSGRLGPGQPLPPTRSLSVENGLSRNSVLQAYELLIAEGYVETRQGSGTRVTESLPEALLHTTSPPGIHPPSSTEMSSISRYAQRTRAFAEEIRERWAASQTLPIDFRYGIVEPDRTSLEAWRRCLSRSFDTTSLGYDAPAGHGPLREALAAHLRTSRGVACTPEQIVITNGSQQALDLVARVLLDPGDRVLIEEPQYQGARQAFQGAGSRLVPIPVDARGIKTDLLRRKKRASLIYVTPSHQFPTGATLPLDRRLKLIDWADRNRAWILEDDYDSEYRYAGRPIQAIHALDPLGRTVYTGTMSKVLFPALRLGYLVLPRSLVEPFTTVKWLMDRMTAPLPQAALAEFLTEGHFDRHLRRTRKRNAARRATLIEELEDSGRFEIQGSNAGIHLMAWIRELESRKLPALISKAKERGVGLYPIHPYFLVPPDRPGLLFGYASLDESKIREGISRTVGALDSAV